MDLTNLKKGTRQKRSVDLSNLVYGKVPPHAIEMEEAVLGAIMLQKDAFEEASDILKKPEVFYRDNHQKVFKAMMSLSLKSQPIDMLTVEEQLKLNGELDLVGGSYVLTKLTGAVVSSANIEAHCKIIVQKFFQREMIRICAETMSSAYEETTDAFELVDDHEKSLTELAVCRQGNRMVPIDTELVQTFQRVVERQKVEDHITGIPSGLADLDHITHGWQDTDLIILAARPSVGKTAFALNLARNAALNQKKPIGVALFSLEMSTGQLTERLLSAESGVWLEKIATGRMEEYDMSALYHKGVQPLSKARLFIDDTPGLNVFELRAKARKLKREKQIGLILIDYLQLMSGGGEKGNREQEISHISRSLKSLAKELSVPIIALSQLSREPEKRKNEGCIPKLSDLRESGAIEQDADVVMFMYRPEYHDIRSNDVGESTSGETHIKIAKHRNGKLETIKLTAKLEVQKFIPYQGNYGPAPDTVGKWKPVSNFYEKEEDDITF